MSTCQMSDAVALHLPRSVAQLNPANRYPARPDMCELMIRSLVHGPANFLCSFVSRLCISLTIGTHWTSSHFSKDLPRLVPATTTSITQPRKLSLEPPTRERETIDCA
jgi:hypothetical protein